MNPVAERSKMLAVGEALEVALLQGVEAEVDLEALEHCGDWYASSRMAGASAHGSLTRCTARSFERDCPCFVPGRRPALLPTL